MDASKFYGRVIIAATMNEEYLELKFLEPPATIRLFDDGQYCCEMRYMRTDDNVAGLVGARLVRVEEKEAPDMNDSSGDHEVQFLEISTDRGHVLIANHNEHNGYYGGFSLACEEIPC